MALFFEELGDASVGTEAQRKKLWEFVKSTKKRDDMAALKQPPKVILDVWLELATAEPNVFTVTAETKGPIPQVIQVQLGNVTAKAILRLEFYQFKNHDTPAPTVTANGS